MSKNFFTSQEECLSYEKNKKNTNSKYPNFKQMHFTAGDAEQFSKHRNMQNGKLYIKDINLDNNAFKNVEMSDSIYWEKYKNLNNFSVENTFNYLFEKFKKGIFVKIINKKLTCYLPFSKANFTNEWSDLQNIIDLFHYLFLDYMIKNIIQIFQVLIFGMQIIVY